MLHKILHSACRDKEDGWHAAYILCVPKQELGNEK